MLKLKLFVASVFFIFLPIAISAGHCDKQCSGKSSCFPFKLEDLQGTYIAYGFTAGGEQPTASVNVFTLYMREDGTGVIPFLSVKELIDGVTILERKRTPLTACPPEMNTVSVTLNADGTGEMLIYGRPTAADIVHLDFALKKEHRKVVKIFSQLTVVEGPSENTPSALAIKQFTFERQCY